MLQTLSGPFPSKVDTLTFTLRDPGNANQGEVPALSDLRLFSSGGGSELLEWDLSMGRVRVSALAHKHLTPGMLTVWSRGQ